MRVSTTEQHVENQRDACLQLCTRHGWEPIVIDETVSGALRRRPGWDSVLSLALGGEIVAVVVSALDRIGRSMNEVFLTIDAIDRAGIRVLSVKEPWLDVGGGGDPLMRKLMLAVFSWAAEFERERLLERSRDGTDQARKEGRLGGRPRSALVGDDLAYAVKMHQAGLSDTAIKKALFERGVHRPRCDCKNCKPGGIGVPKPLPRSSIYTAITRLTVFDGLSPVAAAPKKAS